MNLEKPFYILILFLILYTIVFVANYLAKFKKVKKKKYNKIEEMNYMISKFKLNKKKIHYVREILYISLVNSFIISFTGVFVILLDIPIFMRLAIGFVIIFALIYALYEIYGHHLKKKERE